MAPLAHAAAFVALRQQSLAPPRRASVAIGMRLELGDFVDKMNVAATGTMPS